MRRILLTILTLALACPAQAALLPWQTEQSPVQAPDSSSADPKTETAAEQGTSSSSNSSLSSAAQAQPPGGSKKEPEAKKQQDRTKGTSFKRMFLNVPGDQKAIWTSPLHIRATDSFWLLPLGGVTAGLIGSDEHSMARARSNADAITLGKNVSDYTLAGMASVPALMYVWGGLHGYPRAKETGLLSGEALMNSYVVVEALKFAFARERPTTVDGQGRFYQTLSDPSFPSGHSILGWTLASVIAHEYPGWVSQSLAYSGATAISVSRVAGRKHFPADVVVSGAMGWLIGRQVYRAHHDPDIDDAEYGSFVSDTQEDRRSRMGSVFVPLDSWIYPELKRLAAMGYIRTQFLGLEPWTREECMRQIQEAEYYAQDLSTPSWIARTIELLKSEFSRDGEHFYSAGIDSVYGRYQNISGMPLRDSYHFGQTIWNDFGRPYDQGTSVVTGASGSAVAGRFFFYARGEYQHAPGRGPLTQAQSNLIASIDQNPVLPLSPVAAINRFYPLDIYAGVQLGKFAFSFGKESMWLGPGANGPLMLSNNADPMYGLHLTQTTPIQLPWFFHYLGQINTEFQFTKLSGHQFPARPFFNLQKVSFHPTENLELGFTRASIWAGVGHPFTARALARNFGSFGDSGLPATDPNDPGDRKSGFDFSYKIPGLRNFLSLYGDFYSDDDPSPLASPRRGAMSPGLYLSHFPGISRLDLRIESASTQLMGVDHGGTFLYYSVEYHDSNTNKGVLFGNATGRDGRSYQGWSTYHLSAGTSIQLSYREVKASSLFLPGGGTQSDASTHLLWRVRPDLQVDAFVQYERWLIPALKPTAEHNVTGQLQLTFNPKWRIHTD
ncbi:MAG TPA: capsule assembly Wzi family protein [Candidatus Angelobacter sp.]|nr:capsule assembly Wzi family protein [Candidatus Angelobacter sp.]